jgi:hypothetical protein
MGDICARIRFIIDKYEFGNVSAASRRTKVSQRGLQKVYTGVTVDPHASIVAAIVRAYPAEDPAWILTGNSSPNAERIRSAAASIARGMIETGIVATSAQHPGTLRKRR